MAENTEQTPTPADVNRDSLMLVWHAEGKRQIDMIEPLKRLGLLRCHPAHASRLSAEGEKVCATCENTLHVAWKRYLERQGFAKPDLNEVRGALLNAYETVERICLERYEQDVEIVTETVGPPDAEGKSTTSTTTRKERKIYVALLRLYVEAREKIARLNGVSVDKRHDRAPIPRRILELVAKDADGDGPAN